MLLNITGNSKVLGEIICQMPFLVWVHSLSAGVDHMMCPELENNEDITLTNAKGVFSSSLGEYVMGACSYFAKNIPRLNNQKKEHKWEKFCVKELKGQTMGIVGYGSIGHACARLAKAYGMNVIGLRKNPSLSDNDRSVDKVRYSFYTAYSI